MSFQTRWLRFTLNHPWLSAAILSGLVGIVLGLAAPEGAIVGVVFGVILFLMVGLGQSWQADRATAEEKTQGELKAREPRGLGKWMRTRPWITAAVMGTILAAGTLARVVAEGVTFGRALPFSLALGAGLFVFGGLVGMAARRRSQ